MRARHCAPRPPPPRPDRELNEALGELQETRADTARRLQLLRDELSELEVVEASIEAVQRAAADVAASEAAAPGIGAISSDDDEHVGDDDDEHVDDEPQSQSSEVAVGSSAGSGGDEISALSATGGARPEQGDGAEAEHEQHEGAASHLDSLSAMAGAASAAASAEATGGAP